MQHVYAPLHEQALPGTHQAEAETIRQNESGHITTYMTTRDQPGASLSGNATASLLIATFWPSSISLVSLNQNPDFTLQTPSLL